MLLLTHIFRIFYRSTLAIYQDTHIFSDLKKYYNSETIFASQGFLIRTASRRSGADQKPLASEDVRNYSIGEVQIFRRQIGRDEPLCKDHEKCNGTW